MVGKRGLCGDRLKQANGAGDEDLEEIDLRLEAVMGREAGITLFLASEGVGIKAMLEGVLIAQGSAPLAGRKGGGDILDHGRYLAPILAHLFCFVKSVWGRAVETTI